MREIKPHKRLHIPSTPTPNQPRIQSHPYINQPTHTPIHPPTHPSTHQLTHSPIQQQNNNTTALQTNRACGRLSHARGSTHHQRPHPTNHASIHHIYTCTNPPIHPPTNLPINPSNNKTITPQHYKQIELAGH